MTQKKSVDLSIEGMHCGGCVTRLTAMLKQMPEVDVENVAVGSAQLRIGEGVTTELLAQTVEKAGFKLSEAHQHQA